jgi:hypothetical protein
MEKTRWGTNFLLTHPVVWISLRYHRNILHNNENKIELKKQVLNIETKLNK